MSWDPQWGRQFGAAIRSVGRYNEEKFAFAALKQKVADFGINHLLDIVLELERFHVVWAKHVWWAMQAYGLAERVPGIRRPTQMTDVWRLTMTGRAELGRRKMELETGFQEGPATTSEKSRDADAVVFERPDAEWNF